MKNITSKDVKDDNASRLQLHEKMCILLNKPIIRAATMLSDRTVLLVDYSLN